MVCDSSFRFLNVVAKWPGSVHDARIFRESELCQQLESGALNGYILGDSGYPSKPYLLTPYLATRSQKQERYNRAQVRTHVVIEQSFGILKRRFPCLSYGLRVEPEICCTIIVACVFLHNFGLSNGDTLDSNDDFNDDQPEVQLNFEGTRNGLLYRDILAEQQNCSQEPLQGHILDWYQDKKLVAVIEVGCSIPVTYVSTPPGMPSICRGLTSLRWSAKTSSAVSAYGTCEDGSLNGVKCSAGCCYDNDFPGFWKCCERPSQGIPIAMVLAKSRYVVDKLTAKSRYCHCHGVGQVKVLPYGVGQVEVLSLPWCWPNQGIDTAMVSAIAFVSAKSRYCHCLCVDQVEVLSLPWCGPSQGIVIVMVSAKPRYYNFNPPRTRPVFIEIGSGIGGLLVIIFVFICCCICCMKKLRRTQAHTDQTETASVCQQPNRALPLHPLQVISGNVVRNDIAFQDPPPYELLGANYSSESFHQVVNMQSIFDAGNSIGKPPPYELGRYNYSNELSLQTGNMVQSSPLSNNMAEPPPYAEVVANYNHL
ncbi:HARB1-like protein [Mya arenaria]|uniref:HARB1-like protein n=1 Tax=Mya arenaria TaxID=6604 RepID=A0ABY7FE41_MYAAR|nr:HARB1-like protein [Mya arenaria]